MNRSLTTLLCCLNVFLFANSPAHAQTELPLPTRPHIVVNGYGHVEAVPDLITLHFQASATAANFKLAKQMVDATVGKVFAAAKSQKVPVDNIHAAQINASPQYEWQQKERVYKGEQVSRQIEIKLTNPERYNDLVNVLLDTGIQRLSSVQLDFQQRAKLEQQALTKALDNAAQQAKTISQHLGMKIKTVYQIAPQQQRAVMGRMTMSAEMKAEPSSVGLVLAKQKVEQQMRVVYLLEK